jgi:LAO/AO transport system kinase
VSAALADALTRGDAGALARALSLAEAGGPEGEAIVAAVYPRTGRAAVIGITGPPGAGKSSLASRLVGRYRGRGRSVGVIAVDPSSAFSGGAILGDRIRMQEHALDAGVFIRSMATRGRFGGLSRATRDAVDLMDAAGRDPILLETVGVGQDEVDVVRVADTVLVVLTPGQGDDIQAIKAGLLEIADIFVINKADHPGADRLASDLEGMLSLGAPRDWTPPIVRTVATDGTGLDDLLAAIDRHADTQARSGARAERRRAGLRARLLEVLRDRMLDRLVAADPGGAELAAWETRLVERRADPYSAAGALLGRLEGGGGGIALDHIGVAVRRLEERIPLYRDRLGLPLAGIEEVPDEGVRLALLPAGRSRIELLEPASPGSPVGRFLERRGEGIHHICFEVEDLQAALRRLGEAGLAPAGDAGRPGAEGSRIAFLHPRDTGGVLIELREAPRRAAPEPR